MSKFLNNINLEAGNDIQFKTTAGSNAGKIEQDGNNLVLSNAVGDVLLGDGSSDVYIGDGTNNVDILFEQSGSIKGDGSAVTLTIGGANTTLNLENPNINGALSIGSTSINNKLTFTSSSGYILFDYEPTTAGGEYTSEVPLLKVDRSGSELTVLSRLTNNGAISLGNDDAVAIVAGDTKSVIKDNWNYAAEIVILASEGGFYAYGFPSNDTAWSNRNEFRFRSDSGTASDNGLYIGDGSSTQFIDLSRNLKNIGTIGSGAITSSGSVTATSFIKSGGTTNQFLKANGNVDGTAYAPLANPTFTGTVTVGGILKDGEYHNAGSSSWKTKKYVRSVGVTGADIQGVWVYLARVVLDGSYEKARVKFNINSYDDVASGVEAIDVSYENGPSSQEHHILNWYSTDGNATTFSEVRSIRSSSSGLSNTYDLYVQMSGDWRDTFTVVAESWVSNGSSTPITFPTSAGSSTAPTAGSDDKAATSREWYTSNSQMYSGTNKFWHAGNDGSGSGLDADLLDGNHASAFAPAAGSTSILSLGTVVEGTWNAGVIASAYLDADTAHLSGAQTFSGAKTFSSGLNISVSTSNTQLKLKRTGTATGEFNIYTNNDTLFFNNVGQSSYPMVIDEDGNVGIGTTSPSYRLSVDDNSVTNIPKTLLQFDASSIADNGGYNIDFRTSSNDLANRYVARIRGIRESSGALSQLSFWTESGSALEQRMTIRASGNVGIGTTSPDSKLHVANGNIELTDGYGLRWGDNSVGIYGNAANETVSVYTSATERLRLLAGGQLIVGGTASGYSGTDLQVGNTSDSQNGLNILTSTTGYGYVLFGDGLANADSYVGQISYKHGDDYMAFNTAGTEKIRITSSGELGIGTTSPSDKLDVNGVASASSYFKYKGHSLNMSYGQGGSDSVLFDYTHYSDKAFLSEAADGENLNTTGSSEWVASSDHPFAGGKVLQTSGYRFFYSDFIPVTPGEELYGEIYTKYISGSGGVLYYGIERYDSEKNAIAGNAGTTYFVSSNFNATSTSWTKKSGYTTLPTTHTAYNGSNGGGCYYVRIRIFFNYPSGGAVRQFGGIMLKRTGVAHDQLISGNVGIGTTSPSAKLDVVGGSELNGIVYITDSNDVPLRVRSSDGASMIGISDSNSTNDYSNGIGVYGNALHLTTNGNERIRIDASGNVGIGTTSPSQKLEVRGSIGIERSNGAATSTIDMEGNFIFNAANGYNYKFRHNGADLVHFDQDGNVGIGTTSPSQKLDVQGTILVNNEIQLVDSNMRIFRSSNDLRLRTGGSDRVTINSSGNVGIGTTGPLQKLHVYGASNGASIYNAMFQNAGTAVGTSSKILFVSGGTTTRGADIGSLQEAVAGDATALTFGTSAAYATPTEKLRITSTGNVGIGTTSPSAKLHINGNTLIDVGYRLQLWNDNVGVYRESNDLKLAGFGNVVIKSSATTMTAQTERMRITGAGSVGIGTTSPEAHLHIYSGDSGQTATNVQGLFLENDGSSNSYYAFQIATAVGKSFSITNAGNVGIGITDPDQKLEVDGNIKLTDYNDDIQFGGTANMLSYNQWVASASGGMRITNGASASTGHIAFETSTGEKVRILRDGSVGIGTTSPSQKLEVNGAVLAGDYRGSSNIYLSSPDSWIFRSTAGTERMRLTSSGNVGIGDTSPISKLHVQDGDIKTVQASGAFDGGTFAAHAYDVNGRYAKYLFGINDTTYQRGMIYERTSGRISIVNNTNTTGMNERLTVTTSGKVGIGTNNPTQYFEAFPDLNFSGVIGKAHLGYAGYSDYAAFSHFDQANTSGYALRQGSLGDTLLNAKSGQHIYFRKNNSTIGGFNSSDDFYVDTDSLYVDVSANRVGIGTASPASELDVDGVTTSSGFQTDTSNTNYNLISRNSTSGSLYVQAAQSNSIQTILSCRYGSATVAQGTEVLAVRRNSSYFINTKLGVGTSSPSVTLDVDGPIKHKVYTVSTLPSASPAGQRAFVSDAYYDLASSHGSTFPGGGSYTIPCYSDGSDWRAG